MNLIGLMLVRNSDWCIGLTLRAALLWCDSVVVLMHNCTDGTAEILMQVIGETDEDRGELFDLPGSRLIQRRVIIRSDHSPDWQEMRLRQTMLEIGRGMGGTHFALVDDDELLTANLLPDIRRQVAVLLRGQVLFLPWLQVSPGPVAGVMTSGIWGNQNASVAFRDDPAFHWAAQDGYDHHHRNPMGLPFDPYSPFERRDGGLFHLQFASRRRLLAKQFLYQLIEMKRWPLRRSAAVVAAEYSRTVTEADSAAVAAYPLDWWAPVYNHLGNLDIDATPWQETECLRLLAENPGLAEGLNDFGLLNRWFAERIIDTETGAPVK